MKDSPGEDAKDAFVRVSRRLSLKLFFFLTNCWSKDIMEEKTNPLYTYDLLEGKNAKTFSELRNKPGEKGLQGVHLTICHVSLPTCFGSKLEVKK